MASLMSRGKQLWNVFRENLQLAQLGPMGTIGSRQVIMGVTSRGSFVGAMTLDRFLARARKVLLDSRRVFRWRDTLCFESDEPNDQQLFVIASRQKSESTAGSLLSNLMCVGVQGEKSMTQSLLPSNLVGAILADQQLWRELPVIEYYTRRPLFDDAFNLCGPGWNEATQILVHGPDIESDSNAPVFSPDAKAIDRLPPRLGTLFRDFCWASDADLTNAVALLLTGFLANHFIDNPHPIGIIDGNQKGLGKTLLLQVIGRILDDAEPARIPLCRDDELAKHLGAQLRDGRSSIFFFDNVRERVESALIEANALSPVLSFRILGQSANISRPNGFLWVITSNQTSATEDLISRGLPIRLRYEGNPRERNFNENLLDYVRENRLEILGELAGMVYRWREAGKPNGTMKHRCALWAEVIGGILATAGLTEFLGNVDETEAAMDEGLDALIALAEHVVGSNLADYFGAAGNAGPDKGKPASDWTQLFTTAEVCSEQLASKNPRGRATWIGTFLDAKIGRSVPISLRQGNGTATLRMQEVRSRRKLYWFEVRMEDESEPAPLVNIPEEARSPITTPANPLPAAPVEVPASEAGREGETLDWLS